MVAVDSKRGIGKNNTLPWHLPGDLRHFKQITSRVAEGKRNAVIMGRKTWESLPAKFRPLPGRFNIILSRQASLDLPADCKQASSLDEALALCDIAELAEVFVIGGAELYSMALSHGALKRVYLTEIDADFNCDCFFPDYATKLNLLPGSQTQRENEIDYSFKILEPAQVHLGR